MDPLDRDYLATLIAQRDEADEDALASYCQGRIDEYCAQNALGHDDDRTLDLKLHQAGWEHVGGVA